MPPGKKTPALFELIRDKPAQVVSPRPPEQAHQRPSSKETPTAAAAEPLHPLPELPPEPKPQPVARRPEPEEPRPEEPESIEPTGAPVILDMLKRRVTVPMSAVFVALACIIVVFVLGWAVAHRQGEKQGERQAVSDLSVPDGVPEVRDPLREPAPPDPARGAGAAARNPGPAVTPPTAGDPRIAGLNYLAVEGRLDLDSARRIAAFLTESGVPSIVVGADGRMVDSRATPANNAGSFTVYAAKGITGKEFRDRATVRTELEAEVARLGAIWKREHKGTTDFTRTNWAKHSP